MVLGTALCAVLAAPLPARAGSASPVEGEDAPELTPSAWLNHRGTVTWKSLEGRLVLVERWATT
jgi:hypothetical protein